MTNYDELKKAAEAATPGPWEWPNKGSSDFVIAGPDRLGIGHLDSPRTAEYVALANPATILALLSEHEQQARRIAELEAEVARLSGELSLANRTGDHLGMRVRDLKAEVASLRADAERYRWLRNTGQQGWDGHIPQRGITIANGDKVKLHFIFWMSKEELDAAIDEAMLISPRPEHRHAES